MFTSEPSLSQRIERMIAATPIVDSFSRLQCGLPAAPDLAALMSRLLLAELPAVGMPDSENDPTLPADELVRRALPYLKRARNTAEAWCLFRIFRDLYDFQDPQLNESNYRDLVDKVERSGRDPQWARTVLVDRGNIRTVLTSQENRSEAAHPSPVDVAFRLDLDSLVGSREPLEGLSRVLGEVPASSQALRQGLFDWLDRTSAGPVRVSSVTLPLNSRFAAPDDRVVDALRDADPRALVNFVVWNVLAWHHENRKTLQVLVGTEPLPEVGESLSHTQDAWAASLAPTFLHFSGARFDILAGSEPLAADAAVLVQHLPNVYVSGYQARTCVPPAIERILAFRVQIAPAWKIGGFLSDAPTAEWIYGRLQLVRKATAAALARLVEAGFYEEEEIPPILRQILHDTPCALYDLKAE